MVFDPVRNISFADVRHKRVLIALSGGADSVALLHLMANRRAADGIAIHAAHFHHGIRGQDADSDAAYCRKICAALDVEYHEGRADVPALARDRRMGLETAAREARYAFLRSTQAAVGADVIALAHHMDDQAETILMHLLRGAGPEGICGMARLENGLYRPLLEIRKAQLIQYLQASGIAWREDQTNQIADTPRNALRLHALPEIEKCYPHGVEAIARYGRLARAESDYLSKAADAFLDARLERGFYGQRLLLRGDEDAAILRRAVRKLTADWICMDRMEDILAITRKARGSLDLSKTLRIEKTPHALYFLPRSEKIPSDVPLELSGETILPGICRIRSELGDFPIQPSNDSRVEVLDADRLQGAVLRTRRSGDRIQPLGAQGSRLLSDYLIDRKIDRPLRDGLPLIAQGSRILWACGIGMAQEARITKDTRRRARLEIIPITDEKPEV